MAEEIQTSECNGDRHPEIAQISNIIDQMDTVKVCETRASDPVIASEGEEGSVVCLEDKTDSLEINKENTEEEHQPKQDTSAKQDSGALTSQNTYSEEHSNGDDCKTTLEVEGGNVPAPDTAGQKEINEQEIAQEESKAEAEDIFMLEQTKPLSETTEEEMLTETEEENTSIETDNDNGQGSCDENEYGSGPEQLGSGNRPDISRHSYSRYDTVSYRKIRKGNTKQRIDEFESMMN